MPERFRLLAAVIAAHPDGKVVGRTRLQKTVMLLQRLGLPTDYSYTLHFYGPYSEGLQAEVGLLEHFNLVREEANQTSSGDPYFVLHSNQAIELPEIKPFKATIEKLSKTETTVLELAATYDAFRKQGSDHKESLLRLRRKKGSKCDEGRQEAALALLRDLDLPNDPSPLPSKAHRVSSRKKPARNGG